MSSAFIEFRSFMYNLTTNRSEDEVTLLELTIRPWWSMLWQPLVTTTNSNTNNKSLNKISSGDHKRTRQGVSAELLPYLYNLQIVCANTNLTLP